MSACWKTSPREEVCRKGMVHFYNITKFMSVQSLSWQVLSISRAQRKVCLFLKAINAHVIASAWIVTGGGGWSTESLSTAVGDTQTFTPGGTRPEPPVGRQTVTPPCLQSPRAGAGAFPGVTCIFPNRLLTASHQCSVVNTKYWHVSSSTGNARPLTQAHPHTPDPEAGRF